jgi:hypothetical protein
VDDSGERDQITDSAESKKQYQRSTDQRQVAFYPQVFQVAN